MSAATTTQANNKLTYRVEMSLGHGEFKEFHDTFTAPGRRRVQRGGTGFRTYSRSCTFKDGYFESNAFIEWFHSVLHIGKPNGQDFIGIDEMIYPRTLRSILLYNPIPVALGTVRPAAVKSGLWISSAKILFSHYKVVSSSSLG
jgi:hypothetical protein